jgi:flagellar hook assembly protein FlgD
VRVEEGVVTELPPLILLHCYPNPSAPHTTIQYSLAAESHVTLTVHNVLGQEVRRLVDGYRGAGIREVTWNGRGDAGRRVSSGTYFLQLTVGDDSLVRKLVVVR